MKAKRNLRVPVSVGWLVSGTVIVVGVIIANDGVTNVGCVVGGIVTILASIALMVGHTELLAGASEPVALGKVGKVLVVILGLILLLGGVFATIIPFIAG